MSSGQQKEVGKKEMVLAPPGIKGPGEDDQCVAFPGRCLLFVLFYFNFIVWEARMEHPFA